MSKQGIGPLLSPSSHQLLRADSRAPHARAPGNDARRDGFGKLEIRTAATSTMPPRSPVQEPEVLTIPVGAASPPPEAPSEPVVVRPDPQGSRPRRDALGWRPSPSNAVDALPTPSSSPTNATVPLAYRVIEEFLDEGHRASERWTQPISFEPLAHIPGVPEVPGSLQGMIRTVTRSLERLEHFMRLLQGDRRGSHDTEPRHDWPPHVDPSPDERPDWHSQFGPDAGYIRNPDNRRPT